jgi:hypothetical protein
MSEVAHIPDHYTCAACGNTYNKTWTDEEAHAEALENFGVEPDPEGMSIVCDVCFNRLMGRS